MEKLEKKKMVKMILKVILCIIVIMIVILLVHTIRNYVIITNLQNKISQFSNSTNYYTKSVANESNGTIITMKYYKKDNREVVFLERNLNGEITKVSMYNNGERTDTYAETKDSKVVQLNSGILMSINIYNYLETENNWQTFLGSICSTVKSTSYNGKECYIIKGFMSSTSLTFEGAETYIEKDTGLFVKTTEGKIVTDKEYEFNNVDNSIFKEPDISQYTIKENN